MSGNKGPSLIKTVNLLYWIALPILAFAFVRVTHLELHTGLPKTDYWSEIGLGLLYGVAMTFINVTPIYFRFLMEVRGRKTVYLLKVYLIGTTLVGLCVSLVWQSSVLQSDIIGYVGFVLCGFSIGVGRLILPNA